MNAPINKTVAVVNKIEDFLATLQAKPEQDGLVSWNVFIGNGGPRYVLSHTANPASPNYAFFVLNTNTGTIIDDLTTKLEQHLFNNYPDVSFTIRKLANGAAVSNPVEVRVSGRDKELLFNISKEIKTKLASIAGIKGINDDWGRQIKKLKIDIDEAQSQRLGISNADIARTLQATINGVQVSDFREGEEIIPIMLKAKSLDPSEQELPTSVNILTNDLQSHPIGQLVSTDFVWQSAIVYRRDRLKVITIAADIEAGMTAAEVNKQLVPWLTKQQKSWPVGYRWELGGEAEASGDANASIIEKLPLAGVIIILLLVGQFNCIRRASIIILTIPLGLIGVAVGLNVMNSYMGFMTLLGIISLAGIVINNAIVLIDRIKIEEEEEGFSAYDAIGSAARKRLRPILLTTATTVVGMIPLYLGGGVMWEPMAVAIIFGLLGATVLTLGVVPVLYAMFFQLYPNENR